MKRVPLGALVCRCSLDFLPRWNSPGASTKSFCAVFACTGTGVEMPVAVRISGRAGRARDELPAHGGRSGDERDIGEDRLADGRARRRRRSVVDTGMLAKGSLDVSFTKVSSDSDWLKNGSTRLTVTSNGCARREGVCRGLRRRRRAGRCSRRSCRCRKAARPGLAVWPRDQDLQFGRRRGMHGDGIGCRADDGRVRRSRRPSRP